MTSDIPEHGEGPSRPHPQLSASAGIPASGPPTSANGATGPGTLSELTSFLWVGMRTVVEELRRTNDLRAEMARVLSSNLTTMAAAPDPSQTGEKIAAMIAALQGGDRIRQRIEGLAVSLSVMLSTMEELEAPDRQAMAEGSNSLARPIKDSWARALLDSQCLDELTQSFAARLEGFPETR